MQPRLINGLLASVMFLLTAASAAADGWAGLQGADGARRAGYLEGDRFARFGFDCSGAAPGDIDMIFGGMAGGLPTDVDYPAVLSVDAIAYMRRGRLRPNARGGGSDLVVSTPFADVAPMIEALKRGRSVEISTPSGRFTLPLGGSGKALAILDGGCKS